MLDIPFGYWNVAVEHRALGDPDPWYVTFGYRVGETEDSFSEICREIMTAWKTAWRLLLWNQVRLTGLEVAIGTDGVPLRAFWNNDIEDAGGPTSSMLPQNCALLIKKTTGEGGRRNQGRMFLPLVLSEQSTDNVGFIDAGSVNDYQGKANTFLETLKQREPAEDSGMVILHNDPPSNLAPTPVTNLTVSNMISTQRRRLR